MAPWADILYACDASWWKYNSGAPAFKGLKIGADVRDLQAKYDIKPVKIDQRRDEIMVYKFGTLGYGGNSGFQALNLAVQAGCRTIILVGFDMHDRNGIHWHGKHVSGLNNPTRSSLARWRGVLDAQAPLLERLGVRVINASLSSALTAYPKMAFEAALAAAEDPHGAGIADARQEASQCVS